MLILYVCYLYSPRKGLSLLTACAADTRLSLLTTSRPYYVLCRFSSSKAQYKRTRGSLITSSSVYPCSGVALLVRSDEAKPFADRENADSANVIYGAADLLASVDFKTRALSACTFNRASTLRKKRCKAYYLRTRCFSTCCISNFFFYIF